MKKIVTVFSFFFFSLCVIIGQDNSANASTSTSSLTQKGLRYHLNIGLRHSIYLFSDNSNFSNNINYISPGITMFWQQENSYIELGLADWYFKTKNISDDKEWLLYTSLRVEQGWRINNPEKKLGFFLGYSLQPLFQKYRARPSTPNNFPVDSWRVAVQTEFIPKLSYPLSNAWLIDFSVPFLFTEFGVEIAKVCNPAWTPQQQRQGGFDFDMIYGDFSVRVGVSKVF